MSIKPRTGKECTKCTPTEPEDDRAQYAKVKKEEDEEMKPTPRTQSTLAGILDSMVLREFDRLKGKLGKIPMSMITDHTPQVGDIWETCPTCRYTILGVHEGRVWHEHSRLYGCCSIEQFLSDPVPILIERDGKSCKLEADHTARRPGTPEYLQEE